MPWNIQSGAGKADFDKVLRLICESFGELMHHGVQIAANRAIYRIGRMLFPRVIFYGR
jgi:hypothetical protein